MGTITYDRDKNPATNSTGIATSGEAREDPNGLVGIATGAGTFFETVISGDADPSGGAAIVQLYRIKATPVLGAADPGAMGLVLEITPVLGDGTDGTPFTVQQLVHPQSMTAWQTAAGFPPVA